MTPKSSPLTPLSLRSLGHICICLLDVCSMMAPQVQHTLHLPSLPPSRPPSLRTALPPTPSPAEALRLILHSSSLTSHILSHLLLESVYFSHLTTTLQFRPPSILTQPLTIKASVSIYSYPSDLQQPEYFISHSLNLFNGSALG